ncbi:NAD(P)-binding protein, partial [Cucurbitaria berberidis CBS 394.84]
MVVVAIAGGFGDLGQQFSQAIKATGKHEIIVLKRKGGTSKDLPGFDVAGVDYSDIASLTTLLDERKVHTIVSALGVHWEDAANNQVNLIKAAAKSEHVKRFLPAEYTFDYAPTHDLKPFYCKEYTDANRKALALTDLEWTILYTSQFLDYFGLPNMPTTMNGIYLLLDIPNKVAVLPGDGTATINVVLTTDAAKFVAALLDLPKWDPVYNLVGDSMTLNEAVKTAERATGAKFKVTYDSLENLYNGSPILLPGNEEIFKNWQIERDSTIQFCAAISVGIAKGSADVSRQGTSLNKIFPDMKTVKAEEYIRLCFPNGV